MLLKIHQILFYSLLVAASCTSKKKEHRFEEIGWTISVPEEFEMMDEASMEKMNQSGKRVIEDQTGTGIDSHESKTLFCMRTDNSNYLAATVTPGTIEFVEGLSKGNKNMKDFMFATFKEQMQGAEIDTSTSFEDINSKSFDKFSIRIIFPDRPTFYIDVYSAMVKQYELGITIDYVDENTGKKFTSIIQNSSFK